MHPSQSTQRENRQSNFRVRHSSQGTSLLITTAVLIQTLFAWQSQIKKAQLISSLLHKKQQKIKINLHLRALYVSFIH